MEEERPGGGERDAGRGGCRAGSRTQSFPRLLTPTQAGPNG